MGQVIAKIAKYLIVYPIYTAFRWIIPIMVLYGLPIFIAGILVALVGTLGHMFFIILFTLAVLYYFKHVGSVFKGLKPKRRSNKPAKKKYRPTSSSSSFGDIMYGRNKYGSRYGRY